MVYDCFTFFNELDLLEMRLNILNEVVDKFVLVEMCSSHTYEPKPFIFDENKNRFSAFLDKIIHVKVEDLPEPIPSKLCTNGNRWQLENYQRDCIMRGLVDAKDDDVVMVSDLDEIPDPLAVKQYEKEGEGICYFEQKMMYYFINNINIVDPVWQNGTRIAHFSEMKNPGDTKVREEIFWEYSKKGLPTYFRHCLGTPIENAGWHCSYCGGVEKIIKKRQSICEQEYNTEENMRPDVILKRIYTGRDILDRDYVYKALPINKSFPEYIRNNQEKYKKYILKQTFFQKMDNRCLILSYRMSELNKNIRHNLKEAIHWVRKTLSPCKKFVFRILGIRK